jgi:ATP-dependent DNA helicase RecG
MAHKIILNSAKLKNDSGKTYEFKFDSNLIEEFIRNLDFSLTESQYDAVEEIKKSFSLNHPTSRLIQGDVGSGKTIVVLIASLIACLSKLQTAILVPTEILADQHMKTFNEILKDTNFKIKTLKNNMPDSEKNNIVSELSKGKLDIVIGTHSLLSKQIEFYKLGLVIVDEQHKFGIRQRSALSEQVESPNKMQPHQIFISATPIPRSLSLVLYEGLDYTLIKDLPQGRKTIITKLIHNADKKTLYTSVRNILNKGFQAYWVCPSINQTESSELEYIYDVYEKLQIELKEYSMGMLHGQADKTDNEKAMNNFIMGKHQILVCTTMIEVGVDIENATCIVVEDSNRFGLSQLHQLRGRVGRSNKQSFCYLVYKDNISDDGRARLESLEKNSDGFLIAEEDLKLRGSGDYLGVRQSGYNNNFKLATIDDLITNIEIVKGLKNNIINLRDNNKAKLLSRWGNVESETLRL